MSVYFKHLLAFLLWSAIFHNVYFGINFDVLNSIMNALHPFLDKYDYDNNFHLQTETRLAFKIILGSISLAFIFMLIYVLPLFNELNKAKARLTIFLYPLLTLLAYLLTPPNHFSIHTISIWIIALCSFGLISLCYLFIYRNKKNNW